MEFISPKVEIKTSLLLSHEIIFHKGPQVLSPHFFLVYGAQLHIAHSVLCIVYGVMYVQLIVCMFDYQDLQSLTIS